ncbi:MAG: ABC transporter substrate-binding protein [Bacteroidaceae bacterium]|nr:ABC transporter substrate-binding protein [Bacteroidaceae bacterium]
MLVWAGISFLILGNLCCTACRRSASNVAAAEGDTIPMRYARLITLVRHSDAVEVILKNPWDTTAELMRYDVREPVKRAGVYTAVHCALLQELGVADRIAGVCELSYIDLTFVQEGVRNGRITDMGNSMEPNVERIMETMPDVLLPSLFENSGGYGRVGQLGIPIIPCADYMEASPLARAEWMKFFGILFGVEERADSLFRAVESAYLALCDSAAQTVHRPTLIVEQPYNGIWHVPGGRSTMGILYADAGADYVFRDRPESGSLPMALETVLEAAQGADVWLMKYNQPVPLTLTQLRTEHPAYAQFRAFQQGNVYGCHTTKSHFFEETPFHPERLLADLIHILHPELGITANNSYFCKVKDQ